MEILTYFFRSGIILTLFLGLYFLFLRKDLHFNSNRFFLLFGLIAAALMPLVEINYPVVVKHISNEGTIETEAMGLNQGLKVQNATDSYFMLKWLLITMYLAGVLAFFFRIFYTIGRVLKLKRQAVVHEYEGIVFYENPEVNQAFTFGNRIFIKDADCLVVNKDKILLHEIIHQRGKHWIDMFLCELLIGFQWFNPAFWIYGRVLKENLEFIADRGVLEQGVQLDSYIETIICETMGVEVSVLANHFHVSQNKRRLNMMKNERKSKWQQVKLLMVLPLVGGLLWAFSKPNYQTSAEVEETKDAFVIQDDGLVTVKGQVLMPNDTVMIKNPETGLWDMKVHLASAPLGVAVLIKGKPTGTITDGEGRFLIKTQIDDILVFSFKDYKKVEKKVVPDSVMVVKMEPL